MPALEQYLVALFLAICIEFLVYLVLAHLKLFERKIGRLLLSALIVNSATNPFMNWFIATFSVDVCGLEYAIVLVESILLRFLLKTKFEKALLTSFLANFISYVIGTVVLIVIFH
jgi:hypothetical protein